MQEPGQKDIVRGDGQVVLDLGAGGQGTFEAELLEQPEIGQGEEKHDRSRRQERPQQPQDEPCRDPFRAQDERSRNDHGQDGQEEQPIVDASQGLERQTRCEEDGMPKPAPLEIPVKEEESQGDEPGRDELEMGDLLHQGRAEGEDQPRGDPGRCVPGEVADEQEHRVGVEQTAKEKDEVVG